METKEKTNPTKGVNTPRSRRVDVIVQAHELYPLRPTEKNTDDHTALSDDTGFSSEFGDSNRNYETEVFKDFQMTWDIKAANNNGSDKDYKVELVSVTHNPKPPTNPNLFNQNKLVPKPGSNKKSINGTIVHASPSPEDYTIHFQIFYKDKDPKPFHLDPKLRTNG